jgi:hypothetical protein
MAWPFSRTRPDLATGQAKDGLRRRIEFSAISIQILTVAPRAVFAPAGIEGRGAAGIPSSD